MADLLRNEVVETILHRRSVRKYSEKQITDAELNTILTCAFNAPSGGNGQQWFISVVRNKDVMNRISDAFRSFMLADPSVPDRIRTNLSRPDYSVCFNAPTVFFISYPRNGAETNAAIMGENIVLTAESLGLGTCYLGGVINYLRKPEAEEIKGLLKLPEGYELLFGIAAGYPLEHPEAKPRDLSKLVYID